MMRRSILYLMIVALVAASCEKVHFAEGTISFSAVDNGTRALMDDAALKTAGNKLKVYDQLTGFSGTASWMGADNYYINDEIVYAGNPVWDFTSNMAYPWTTDGTHKFFSWLSYDQSLDMTAASFCGASFNAATQVLSIPQKVMDTSTAQFDFMYSDVLTVPAESHTAGTPVNLPLHHLFTALNLRVQNTSGNTIYLKRVTLVGMKNKRSATIDFSSTEVQVTTADFDSVNTVLFQSDNAEGTVFNNNPDSYYPLTDFILMWPQTAAELDTNARLVVDYSVLSNEVLSDNLSANVVLSRQVSLRNMGLEAGTKYTLSLQFKKSTLEIQLKVLPWEYEAYDWNYADHSISARSGAGFKDGVLAFYRQNPGTGEYSVAPTTDEWSAKTMRFTSRSEQLKGRFFIEAPTSGRWQVTTYPLSAAEYFIVEPSSGDIDAFTDDGKVEFTVRANPDRSPSSTQTLFFNVAIFFNGEWHDANSEFNRKNIRLVLDAN